MSLFGGRYVSPLKSDGTQNVGGKVYFYETGTSTLKSVYTDEELTTAHTNPVILDAAGSALIFLGLGSYDYKVDDSDDSAVVTTQGPISNGAELNVIVPGGDLIFTVDGVGSTATTFSTIALAMDAARGITIQGGKLTISINDGTYLDEDIDFTHPQGNSIYIEGQSEAGTIIKDSRSNSPVIDLDGITLKSISNLTIERSGAGLYAIYIRNGGKLLDLDSVTVKTASGNIGVYLTGDAYITMNIVAFDGAPIQATNASTINYKDTSSEWTFTNGGSQAITSSNNSSVMADSVVITGFSYPIRATANAFLDITACDLNTLGGGTGVTADFGATIIVSASFDGSEGTQYSPAKDTIKNITGTGSDDLAIIH